MRIGIHTSTSGALEKAALKAHELGANTFQIFSASPRIWRAKAPDPEQVRRLRGYREKHDLHPLVIHGSYLINLAAPASALREQSIAAFTGELERALIIGADFLVTHPGNYREIFIASPVSRLAARLILRCAVSHSVSKVVGLSLRPSAGRDIRCPAPSQPLAAQAWQREKRGGAPVSMRAFAQLEPPQSEETCRSRKSESAVD